MTDTSNILRNLSDEADRILVRMRHDAIPAEVLELLRKLAEAGK